VVSESPPRQGRILVRTSSPMSRQEPREWSDRQRSRQLSADLPVTEFCRQLLVKVTASDHLGQEGDHGGQAFWPGRPARRQARRLDRLPCRRGTTYEETSPCGRSFRSNAALSPHLGGKSEGHGTLYRSSWIRQRNHGVCEAPPRFDFQLLLVLEVDTSSCKE
jgi:hypothetical protein